MLFQHQTHHRGQAHAMLAGTKVNPPQLDEFFLAGEQHLRRDELLELGLLSISWSRVLPNGKGNVNPKGLEFYDRLIDALLAANITPFITLFHWDYPYALYCQGGWLNSDSPDWFADYVSVVVNKLSDRVRHWMTLNEPQVFLDLGHHTGTHAPGLKLGMPDVLRATHHVLLAHGKGVQAIRANSKTQSQVGYAPVGSVITPASSEQADIEMAYRLTSSVHSGNNLWNNTWFSDPIFFKEYPADGLEAYGDNVPEIHSEWISGSYVALE